MSPCTPECRSLSSWFSFFVRQPSKTAYLQDALSSPGDNEFRTHYTQHLQTLEEHAVVSSWACSGLVLVTLTRGAQWRLGVCALR